MVDMPEGLEHLNTLGVVEMVVLEEGEGLIWETKTLLVEMVVLMEIMVQTEGQITIEQYPGSGGSGGGGSGGWHVYQGNPGTANTGGGGGGGSRISGGGNGPSQARLGGVGGSGVCIIRYVV